MTYTTRSLGRSTEFRIDGEAIMISENRHWRDRAWHVIPRSALSEASGWVEQRDKSITSIVQLIALAAFLGVIFFCVQIERSGPLLWAGIIVTIGVMVVAPLLSPRTRHFVAYSSAGQPAFSITDKRDVRGKAEFEAFVAEYKKWIGGKKAGQARPDNAG